MNKKRLLALLLALCMVFALFACGEDGYDDYDDDDDDEKSSQKEDDDDDEEGTDPTGTEPTTGNNDNQNPSNPTTPGGNSGNTDNPGSNDDNQGTQNPSNPGGNDDNQGTQQPQPDPNSPSNPGGDDDNQGTQQPDDPQEPEDNTGTVTPPPAVDDTILGRWEGDTYINKYLGFKITVPADWNYTPVDSSVDPANPFPDSSVVQITDMEASSNGGNSIRVDYQNPSAPNGGITSANTEEENIDLILAEEDTLRGVYESMGWTVSKLDKEYVSICGEMRCVLMTVIEVPAYGLEMHIAQLYTYGNGDTPVTITIGGMSADDLTTLLNMFVAI